MEALVPNPLAPLGDPQCVALFRILMRRWPDRVPMAKLARAHGLEPNTLSRHLKVLMQAGLVTQERVGTSMHYAIDMDAALQTIDHIPHDCCRGRPTICMKNPYLTTVQDIWATD